MSGLTGKAILSSAVPGIVAGSAAGLLGSALFSDGDIKDHAKRAAIFGAFGGAGKLAYDVSNPERFRKIKDSHKPKVLENTTWNPLVHAASGVGGAIVAPRVVSKITKKPLETPATKGTRAAGAAVATLLSILTDWGVTKLRSDVALD
jgi:hypothetical protein